MSNLPKLQKQSSTFTGRYSSPCKHKGMEVNTEQMQILTKQFEMKTQAYSK